MKTLGILACFTMLALIAVILAAESHISSAFDDWHAPTGGIIVRQSTYEFKYVLHEIHVNHTRGTTDTTYVYRVLCQEAD